MSRNSKATVATNNSTQSRSALLALGVVSLWMLTAGLLSARVYCVMPYAAISYWTPLLEPLGCLPTAIPVCLLLAAVWLWLVTGAQNNLRGVLYLLLATAPLVPWLLKVAGIIDVPATFVEIIWLSGWTGASFRELVMAAQARRAWFVRDSNASQRLPAGLWILIAICVVWWYAQSAWYHENFMLGYNDFGHFLQRLHNTLSGRGILIESPVLPRFWDHFNPGLLLLLPAWMAWPDVHQSFAWQAVSLGVSAVFVFKIARAHLLDRFTAALFGTAWLVHPAIGQMNLAYTYGWHPITFAIPLLLATIWALLVGRRLVAVLCCAVALTMEEGVFVIVSLTALVCGAWQWRRQRLGQLAPPHALATGAPAVELAASLRPRTWLVVGCVAAGLFVIIYRTSGLAEFQAGRFSTLGSNTAEILMSPILRPRAFWGALVSSQPWYYAILLALPCSLTALLRGWQTLLPTLLPLAVLTVWNHQPAHSIAFQYASTLMPLLFLSAIVGAARMGRDDKLAASAVALSACVTGIVLSLMIGQLPYSGQSLLDVDGRTYGNESEVRRRAGSEDGRWLTEQLQQLRAEKPTCLATGRVAAHLVGLPDLETVGQYLERRELLARLDSSKPPIHNYEWIVLDRRETFQQKSLQIQTVELEARAEGYVAEFERYDIVFLRRRER